MTTVSDRRNLYSPILESSGSPLDTLATEGNRRAQTLLDRRWSKSETSGYRNILPSQDDRDRHAPCHQELGNKKSETEGGESASVESVGRFTPHPST